VLNQSGNLIINRGFFSSKAEWAGRILVNVNRNNRVLPDDASMHSTPGYLTSLSGFLDREAFKLGGEMGARYPLSRLTRILRVCSAPTMWSGLMSSAQSTLSVLPIRTMC
jgi:hypothetical protein